VRGVSLPKLIAHAKRAEERRHGGVRVRRRHAGAGSPRRQGGGRRHLHRPRARRRARPLRDDLPPRSIASRCVARRSSTAATPRPTASGSIPPTSRPCSSSPGSCTRPSSRKATRHAPDRSGWPLYLANCQPCHGIGGRGATRGPDFLSNMDAYRRVPALATTDSQPAAEPAREGQGLRPRNHARPQPRPAG
jgi:hypothetical protein